MVLSTLPAACLPHKATTFSIASLRAEVAQKFARRTRTLAVYYTYYDSMTSVPQMIATDSLPVVFNVRRDTRTMVMG